MTNFHVGQKTRSLRLGLVRRLKRRLYQLAQNAVEYLREDGVHPQSRGNFYDRLVPNVRMDSAQGYANRPISNPLLREAIDEYYASAIVPNIELGVSNSHDLSGLHNNFVNHGQGSNISENLNAFAAQQMGTEGFRNNEQFMQLQAERLRGLFPKKSSGGGK